VVGAARSCRCGNPVSVGSADRCATCEDAWQVWASVDVWGDRVICPTCDRLADGEFYPTADGGLRCSQCIDGERWAVRTGDEE
jgi:hypothetical protein